LCTLFFPLFIVVCIHLKCYTSHIHLIMCALCENTWLTKLLDLKKKDVLFSSMFFFLWLKFYFDVCLDHLIKFYASHHYYILETIWYQLIYTCTHMFWVTYIFIFQKKGENLKRLKTYIFVKLLTKMKLKTKNNWRCNNRNEIDQIMLKDIHLWIILSLKLIFDIF